MADIMDYWSGAGYGQIPVQSPYQTTSGYKPPDPWANANTYAPWNSQQIQGMGGGTYQNKISPWVSPLGSLFDNILGGGLSGKGKKRIDPNFYAPSYQGASFTPQEGLPQYYMPSQETTNQTQQQLYAQNQAQQNPTSLSAAITGPGYDYNYGGGQPNYVGQQETAYGSFYGSQPKSIYNTFNPSNPYGM